MKQSRRVFFAGTAPAAAFAIGRAPAKAADFEYKLGHDMSASHPIGTAANEFAAAVRKQTNSRLEVKVFPDSILGNAMIPQVRQGALEMVLSATSPISALTPVANLGYIGYSFARRQDVLAALDGDVGGLIRKEAETKGLVGFPRSLEAGFRQMTSWAKPIRTPEDYNGLKVRVPPTPIAVDLFRAFGASPVPTAVSEVYTSLQTHVVDGADGAFINLFTQKLYEVQKYVSVTNHQWSGYWLWMNPEAWKRLPSDIQAVVSRTIDAVGLRQQRYAEQQNAAAADVLQRHGMVVGTPDSKPFRARLGAYYAKWKTELGPAAWATLEKSSGPLG